MLILCNATATVKHSTAHTPTSTDPTACYSSNSSVDTVPTPRGKVRFAAPPVAAQGLP